jgi:hypothetical protein
MAIDIGVRSKEGSVTAAAYPPIGGQAYVGGGVRMAS